MRNKAVNRQFLQHDHSVCVSLIEHLSYGMVKGESTAGNQVHSQLKHAYALFLTRQKYVNDYL